MTTYSEEYESAERYMREHGWSHLYQKDIRKLIHNVQPYKSYLANYAKYHSKSESMRVNM